MQRLLTKNNKNMRTTDSNSKPTISVNSKDADISLVSAFLKCGWIDAFDDSVIECTLRKDYELDEELTFGRGLLTEKQNNMVCRGLVVRYNKQSNSIQFLLEDGVNWC
jgi:hypothetical protein